MNPFAFLKKQKETPPKDVKKTSEDAVHDDEEEINIGTKVKIVSAMLVVAVATYVALWVQEPTDLKIDVINGSAENAEQASGEDSVSESVMVAAAEESAFPVLAEVSITDFTFTPANMTVKKGTTVVWTNMDPVDHTVTADTFSSSALEPGDSYNYTFEEAGEYPYSCSFHPQMTGKIVVTDEPAEEDTSEDDEADIAEDEAEESEADVVAETPVEDELPSIAVMEDFDFGKDTADDMMSQEDIDLALAALAEDTEEAQLLTLDADELLAEGDIHNAAVAVQESDKLAKSGPEDILYIGMFAAILYFNRRKILGALQ